MGHAHIYMNSDFLPLLHTDTHMRCVLSFIYVINIIEWILLMIFFLFHFKYCPNVLSSLPCRIVDCGCSSIIIDMDTVTEWNTLTDQINVRWTLLLLLFLLFFISRCRNIQFYCDNSRNLVCFQKSKQRFNVATRDCVRGRFI